jgi:repressor LexA
MIDAEIYDGDIVFLKRTPDVENGQIGAVLVDDEATLKRIYKTTDALVLQPCNSSYAPIIVDGSQDVMILGECVGVYHATK